MNGFERTTACLAGDPVDRVPTHPLFMRYAADFINVTYADYVRDYRLLTKAQFALADRFPLDLVSCCSDSWREVADCGAVLEFPADAPPHAITPLLQAPADLMKLKRPDPLAGGRMTDRIEAIRTFADSAKGQLVILGWVEGPIAGAVNLCGMTPFMKAIKRDRSFACDVMDWIVDLEIAFATAQVEAGADMIGLGDAAASLVAPSVYAEEIVPRERRLIDAIHQAGASARLHICGDVHGKFNALAETGADLLDVDFLQTIAEVRSAVGPEVCLAGNVDPVGVLLNGTPDEIRAACATCRQAAGPRYMLAAGCEIAPQTPDANLDAFFAVAASPAP
jgi:MtaA/CmuA family methyltransferase